MSPIKTLPGPPWNATGDPVVNNDCSDASDGVLPEGHEINNELHDAATIKANRPSQLIVGIVITEVTLVSFLSVLRRFGVTVSSSKVFVANVTQKN
jgi:hypothetical protein